MHDILLIQPMVGNPYLYTEQLDKLAPVDRTWLRRLTRVPQGLLSIGSYLSQNGYRVKIFDSRLHLRNGVKQLETDLINEVKQTQLMVGISVLTMHIPQAIEMSALIRAINPNLPIIWGGYHPTLYPMQTASDPAVDFVVYGEGEEPMLKLAQALESHRGLELVPSLYFKQNASQLTSTVTAKSFDPDEVQLNYDLLEIHHYLEKQSYNPDEIVQGLDYNGSRGCPYNCGFCINKVLPQLHLWRARSVPKITADLQALKDRYHIKYAFFEEELPFANRERSFELAKSMEKLDLNWYGNIRVDMVHNDRSLLEALRRSGWSETSVGVESGSDRMLKYLCKGTSVSQVLKTANILNELNVYCLYSFMTDLPTETTQEKLMTFQLMRKLRRMHPKSEFIGAQTYRLYPKTQWYDELVSQGKFTEPTTLREWVTSGLTEFYAR